MTKLPHFRVLRELGATSDMCSKNSDIAEVLA